MNGHDPKPIVGQPQLQLKPRPAKFVLRESEKFHIVHADGVWGMLNSHGTIQINFFVEHPPVPNSVTFPLRPDGLGFTGQMLEEYKDQDENNFVMFRDFQVGVALSLDAAKYAHTVLGNFIALAEDQLKMAEQAKSKTTKSV